nr:hypothetical protein [Rosenbergiella nectarea]
MVGCVTAVGEVVAQFRVGDYAAVGWIVRACPGCSTRLALRPS